MMGPDYRRRTGSTAREAQANGGTSTPGQSRDRGLLRANARGLREAVELIEHELSDSE
jgi:hypothetical protein